ncbi:MAG: DUF3617 family protein [Caldimonas sp.]
MKTTHLILLLACIASPCAHAQSKPAVPGPGVKPGLWETTLVVEAVGSTNRRSVVGRACFSAADASDLARVVPKQREFGMKCENRDIKVQGASANWRIVCASAETTISGTGSLTAAGAVYSGSGDVEVRKRGGKAEKVAQKYSGKWLEACK